MTAATALRSATWKTAATFRRLIELMLKSEGLPVEARPAHRRTLADAMTGEQSHIRGLSRWAVVTNTQTQRDLSGQLDLARRYAEDDGKDFAAAIFHRPGRDTIESYVLVTFSDWVQLVKELEAQRP